MERLKTGIVKEVAPIGTENGKYRKISDGERIVFHLISVHPRFNYDEIYGCLPKNKKDCLKCQYKFECFTIEGKIIDEKADLIKIKFKGKTIGIFPSYWRTPRPTANELEAYLWGESNGRLQVRQISGGGWV